VPAEPQPVRSARANVTSARDLLPRTAAGRLAIEVFRFVRKGFARVYELFPARLNLSWVNDKLAVGGAFHRRDIPRLRKLGIRAVVDCREEAADDEEQLRRHDIDYLRLPTPDAHELSQANLRRGAAWAREHLQAGEPVYIHCHHGVGRAPLLASCVLVEEGETAQDALQRVKAHRWQASPNAEQLEALVRFAQEHAQRTLSDSDADAPRA
jgi:protein tyrosine phosphatase (PTP) superfamily phosphohydrolase (DUF442 family)